MRSEEIKEKAKKWGIKPKLWMKKGDLIRAIQSTEGNFPCFGTAKDYCDQLGCIGEMTVYPVRKSRPLGHGFTP